VDVSFSDSRYAQTFSCRRADILLDVAMRIDHEGVLGPGAGEEIARLRERVFVEPT
jgi:hypothetical protein